MDKGKILIVDDSKSVLKMLDSELSTLGYTVFSANNGQEGWDFVRQKDVDLVVSDLEMPYMDGFEFCHLVKSDTSYKHIYFIILSNRQELGSKIHGLEEGADDYITKSTSAEEMLARVDAGMRVVHLQKELKETQSYLYQQEKMVSIGQLAAGVAHEINNPIGFVKSNLFTLTKYVNRFEEFITVLLESMKEEAKEEVYALRKKLKIGYILNDAKDLVDESLHGVTRVANIIEDLKTFSHVDESETKPVNINDCLENSLSMVGEALTDRIIVEKDFGDLPEIQCYGQLLNQVFLNILINAVQSIEKEGEIFVKTLHRQSNIFVSITDNGKGIAEENIHRLFEPFFKAKDAGTGVGLGLSVSYDIIKRHDGDITVSSKLGKGTTFTIRLPVNDKPPE